MPNRSVIKIYPLILGLLTIFSFPAKAAPLSAKFDGQGKAPDKKTLERTRINRALLAASAYGDLDYVKKLFKKKADVNTKWFDERTPLMEAARSGHVKIVEFLLDAGADPKAVDEDRNGALHHAMLARNNQAQIVQLLARHGADIRLKGSGNVAVLHSGYYNPETIRFLIANGAKGDINHQGWGNEYDCRRNHTVLNEAAGEPGQTEMVRYLISQGADVNLKTCFGITSLTEAVNDDNIETAIVLIEAGANVNAQKIEGTNNFIGKETVLMGAAFNGTTPMVRLLLASGADANIKDDAGRDALFYARRGLELGVKHYTGRGGNHTEVIELLQKAGAKE
ncbi:MAG: ankyrin repeat domain-containing protein [Elusimicrobia bacterium]|nr:ankyrin repeat domain-containing protein [Elusimicrobiota bacterium]